MLRWILLFWIVAALAGVPLALPAGELRRIAVEDAVGHWVENYLPLVPAIHLPTTHDRDDLIQVWLRLPDGGRIDVEEVNGGRPSLVYPDGAVLDRLEYFYLGSDEPRLEDYAPFAPDSEERGQWSVADVRGTRLRDGAQHFHVLRPASGEPHAPLTGWSWQRGDPDAQGRATRALVAFAREHPAPLSDLPMGRAEAERLAELNDCARCHQPNLEAIRSEDSERSLKRATDTMGFFVPLSVLHDDSVIADHRPEDLNGEDPFVSIVCDDGRSVRFGQSEDGSERYHCADESVPRGVRDVAAGLRASHPYTEALCDSRAALYTLMTPRARAAFAPAFRSCGIEVSSEGGGSD